MKRRLVFTLAGGVLALLAALTAASARPAAAHFYGSTLICDGLVFEFTCTLTIVANHDLPAGDLVTVSLSGNAQFTATGVGVTGGTCGGLGGPNGLRSYVIANNLTEVTIYVDVKCPVSGTIVVTQTLRPVWPGGGGLEQRVASAAYRQMCITSGLNPECHNAPPVPAKAPDGSAFRLPDLNSRIPLPCRFICSTGRQ